jgi:predicted Zn finger-like uncharacterized protein
MKVNCPGCSAEFAVDDNRIPPQGLKVRCPQCFKSIEVGGGDAPASDLEASLGIDLSGPSVDPQDIVPEDGWAGDDLPVAEPAPAAPAKPTAPATSPDAGDSEEWGDLDPLSDEDISLIGTYERVAASDEVVDNVWGGSGGSGAGELPDGAGALPHTTQPKQDDPADDDFSLLEEGPLTLAEGPAGSAEQEAVQTMDAVEISDSLQLGQSSELFEEEATSPDRAASSEAKGEEVFQFEDFAEASDPGDLDGSSSSPLQPPPVPPEEATDLEPTPEPLDDLAHFDNDQDLFGSEGAPSALEEESTDAPDSIFAIEERSGVFESADIGVPDAGAVVEEDDWDFGEVAAEPEPESGGTQLGMPDPSVSFKRDSLTQEHDVEALQEAAGAEAPTFDPDPPEQPITAGGPTLDDIDFASLLDEVPGDKAADSQVFFVDSPSVPDGDDFEKPKGDDSFSMEELSFDELDSLDESTEFESTGEEDSAELGEDDLFDLDMDPSEMDAGMPSLEAELPTPQVKGGEAVGRRPARRKRRSGLGILVVLLVIGGGGFGAWQLGLLDSLLGNKGNEPLNLATTAKKNEAAGPRLLESPDDFNKRLQTLTKQLELRADKEVETSEEMLWVLAWYQFLFTDTFKVSNGPDGKPLLALYEGLREKRAGQVFKLKLEAMDLAAKMEWGEADKVFNDYLQLKNRKMAELLEKSKITAQVAREDNLLTAWFAVETGKLDDAEALLKDLQGEKSGELYPSLLEIRTFAGRALAAEKAQDEQTANTARVRASDRLQVLVEKYPKHVPSKLLLSQLYAKQERYDDAIALATKCLVIGKESKNFGLQIESYRALASYLQATQRTDQLFTLLEQMKTDILGKKTGLAEPEDLLLLLCKLYLARDKVAQALGALTLCGKSCSSPEYFLLHARSYEMSNLPTTAIDRAKAGHEKYPSDADLLMILARLAKATGQTNSSVAYLEKILALRPDNTKAALTLANLFLELQDPPNARKVLMEAERYVEDSLELQEMLAQINEAMGDDPGIISALTKILELKGEAPEVRKKLAGYQVKQGNYQDALSHYEILEKQGLITPELRQDYAECLRATGRTQDALDVLKELLRDNPSDVETARFLADIYLQKEDYFNAKLYLEATRRADTTNPEVHHLVGTTCMKLEDDNCALESFQKAVELDPEKLEYVENLANLLYKKSRSSEGESRRQYLKQARKYFLYVISSYERKDMPVPEDRRNADVYFNHGQILFETGHYEKALRDLDKAMALAKHRVDMLVMYADTLYKMNRYKEAVKYYQEMLDSDLDKAHAYFYLGKIHLVRDQREKAKGYFLKCIALGDKAYPKAHKHLGDIFREKRLRKKAIDHYRTFLKLTPANDPAAEDLKASLKRL